MDNNKYIFKCKNPYKNKKKRGKMGIGEYASFLTFGIISTGALVYRPMDLPLFILGAFVFSLIIAKFINWAYFQINKSKINFIILSFIAGMLAFIGIWVSTKTGLIFKINGVLWMFMGILIMKFNLDDILE